MFDSGIISTYLYGLIHTKNQWFFLTLEINSFNHLKEKIYRKEDSRTK